MDIQHLPRRPISGKRKQLRRLSPARQQQIQPPEARSAGTEAARSLDLKYPKLRNNNCNLALQQPDPAESERNQDASDRRGGIARSRNTPASPRYLRLSADKSGKINTCSTTHRQAHGALTGKKRENTPVAFAREVPLSGTCSPGRCAAEEAPGRMKTARSGAAMTEAGEESTDPHAGSSSSSSSSRRRLLSVLVSSSISFSLTI